MSRHDVDQFANEVSMRTLSFWAAFHLVEPFGDEWRRTARLARKLRASFGAETTDEDEERFLPGYKPRQQTEAEMEAELMKVPMFAEQIRKRKQA